MNEITKTITLVAVAAVVALIAFVSRPSLPVEDAKDMVGRELFAEFTDPLAAASLEILEFDEDTASVRPFKVAQVNDRWSIPSHDNYPADAKDQLADVAAGLMALKVLDTASDNPGDHELYGVVDPDPEKLSAGATGVGTRVTMKDTSDKTLLSLVIGKEVPDQNGLHYVRRTGQDPVYTVALKTSKISTSFEDWIEEDLLKLSSWDIEGIEVRDYSIDELRGTLNMRNRLKFDYNDTGDPKWELAKDLVFGGKDWIDNPKPMTEDEELDTEKLDDMRRALDDLEIVDVATKPEGLSADLGNLKGADQFLNNREAVASLQSRGFYAVPWQDRVELFSNEGEIRCLTDEGVNYILRFGNIAGAGSGKNSKEKEEETEKTEDAAETEGEDDEGDDSGGVNRFLFVMAEFDESVFEKPEMEPPPEAPKKEDAEKDEKKDGEAAAEDDKAEDDKETADEDKEGEAEASDEEKADDEKSDDQKKYEEEVARVEKENKRKQDEYDEKVTEGKEKVDELNRRFADWYYIISDEVYQKIHLGRDDVIKKKEKEEKEGKEGEEAEMDEAEAEKPADKPAAESPKEGTEKPAEAKPAEKPAAAAAEKPAETKPDEKPGEPEKPSPPPAKKPAESAPAEKPKGEAPPAKK